MQSWWWNEIEIGRNYKQSINNMSERNQRTIKTITSQQTHNRKNSTGQDIRQYVIFNKKAGNKPCWTQFSKMKLWEVIKYI